MATRGVYGFYKNGKNKIGFNFGNSDPCGLGKSMIEFCMNISLTRMNEIFDRIRMIEDDETSKPTATDVEKDKIFTDEHLLKAGHGINEWYTLTRKLQGNLMMYDEYEEADIMIDRADFIKNSLSCEYGYIINLDNNTLELYKGRQHEPQEGNRYGQEVYNDEYYPCALKGVIKTDDIKAKSLDETMDYIINILDDDE